MPVQFQTSFIPKRTPVGAPPPRGTGGRHMNVLSILATLVFFVTIGIIVAMFFYKSYLLRTIADMDASLAAAKKSFEPEFINEAARLNARMEGAKELLDQHRAVSPLFDILEKKTLESVRFQDFNFNAGDGQKITLTMTGAAKSFNAVALQSDVFGGERSFKDPVFSNFTLSENGDVVFKFSTTIDPGLLRYRETLVTKSADTSGAEVSSTTAK